MEHSVGFSIVTPKSITLELDAYEKLQQAKRGGESFTEVAWRDVWLDIPATGQSLRDHFHSGGSGVSDEYLDSVAESANHGPIPAIPWV